MRRTLHIRRMGVAPDVRREVDEDGEPVQHRTGRMRPLLHGACVGCGRRQDVHGREGRSARRRRRGCAEARGSRVGLAVEGSRGSLRHGSGRAREGASRRRRVAASAHQGHCGRRRLPALAGEAAYDLQRQKPSWHDAAHAGMAGESRTLLAGASRRGRVPRASFGRRSARDAYGGRKPFGSAVARHGAVRRRRRAAHGRAARWHGEGRAQSARRHPSSRGRPR